MIYTIPGFRLGKGLNDRTHWPVRAKRVKLERTLAFNTVKRHDLPLVITITRISPGTLDDDNLRGACKAIRDGIADRLGIDDRLPAVQWCYEQEKRGKGVYGVVIKVEPMPAEQRIQCVQPSLLEAM